MARSLRYECLSNYLSCRDEMLRLHRRGYGSVSEKLYDSLYLDNPYGDPLLALCYDQDTLVGQENYIRQDIAWAGRVWKGGLGINTFVDPAYRVFHGVFGKLCKLSVDKLEPQLDVLCAYANEDSKAYYLKYFDWKIESKVRVYKKAVAFSGLNAQSALSLFRRGKGKKGPRLEAISAFEPKVLHSVVEEHAKHAKDLYFYKTPEYLNWRYLRNKHYDTTGYYIIRDDEVCGYCVTYDQGIERKIVDILVLGDDLEVFKSVIGRISSSARKEGKKRLVMYATPGCWYESTLKRLLFIMRWEFDYITRRFNEDMKGGNWLIQIGDFDIF